MSELEQSLIVKSPEQFYYPRLPPVAFFETDADGIEWLVVSRRDYDYSHSLAPVAVSDSGISGIEEPRQIIERIWKYTYKKFSLDPKTFPENADLACNPVLPIYFQRKSLLHAVPRKFNIKDSFEANILNVIEQEFQYRAWDLYGETRPESTKKLRGCSARNRSKLWSVKNKAAACFNKVWKELVERTADKSILKICYRYPIRIRMAVYVLCCRHERYRQLCESFPYLATLTASDPNFFDNESAYDEQVNILKAVIDGVPLRDICQRFNIDFKLRKVKPQNTLYINSGVKLPHDIALPKQVCYQRNLIRSLCNFALNPYHYRGSGEHGYNVEALDKNQDHVVKWFINNVDLKCRWEKLNVDVTHVRDWIQYYHQHHGEFPLLKCSWKTALCRADEWSREINRRRVQEQLLANEHRRKEFETPFPEQWIPDVTIGNYRIEYLKNEHALIDEGQAMEHCVASYAHKSRHGDCQIYSVTDKDTGDRVGTLELQKELCISLESTVTKDFPRYKSVQFRGKHNSNPPNTAKLAVAHWIREINLKLESIAEDEKIAV